jgi:UDP-N-acetylmuramate dehydrogenase
LARSRDEATSFLQEAHAPGQTLFSELTTIGVGGPAERIVDVPDVATLARTYADAKRAGTPVLVLGGGSNLVVSDKGFAGTVARLGIRGVRTERDGDFVLVETGAGEEWSSFVQYCVAEGLSGLECTSGIPGLAGATPVQNVGAYGCEVSDVICAVAAWGTAERGLRRLTARECGFGYRTSAFKQRGGYVVTSVTFRLQYSQFAQPLRYAELAGTLGARLGDRPPLAETAAAVVELRRRKGMVLDDNDPDTRSAGSFFMNPVLSEAQMLELSRVAPGIPRYVVTDGIKVPAAWLVEQAGFRRGYRAGKAAISSKHSLAITAEKGAPASDVAALAKAVRDGVARRFGVRLEPEPVLVGLHL